MKEYNNSEKSEESEESEEENITTTKKPKHKPKNSITTSQVSDSEITSLSNRNNSSMKKYNNNEESKESEEEIITTTKKPKHKPKNSITTSQVSDSKEITSNQNNITNDNNKSIEEINTDIKEEQENKLTDEEIKKIIEEITTDINEEIKKRNEEIEKIKQGAEKKMLNKKDKKYLSYLDQPYKNEDDLERIVSIFNTYMLVNMPGDHDRNNYFLKNRILKTLSEKEIRAQKFYQDMVQIAKHQTDEKKMTTFSFYSEGSGGKLLVADKITKDEMEIAFYVHKKPGGSLSHIFGHFRDSATFPPEDIIPRNAQEYGATISKIFQMLKEDVPEIKIALVLAGTSLGTHLMMNLCNTTFKNIDFKKLDITLQQIPTTRIVRTNYVVRPENKANEMFTFLKSKNILHLLKEEHKAVHINFIVSNGSEGNNEMCHAPKGSFVFFNKLEKLIEDDETLKLDDRNLLKELMHNSEMLFGSNFPETFMRFLKDVLDKNQLDIEPCDMVAKYNILIRNNAYGNTITSKEQKRITITSKYKERIRELIKHKNIKATLIKDEPQYTVEDFIKDFTLMISYEEDDTFLKELGLRCLSDEERLQHNLLFKPFYTANQPNQCMSCVDFKKFIYAMQLKKKLKTQHQTFYQKTMENPHEYRGFMKKILVQQQDVDNVIDKLNDLEDIAESYDVWINPTEALTDEFNILRDIHLNHFEKMKSAIFEKNDTAYDKLRKEKLLKQIIVNNFCSCPRDFVLTPNHVENFTTYAKRYIDFVSICDGGAGFPLYKDFTVEKAQKIENIARIKNAIHEKIKQFIVNKTLNVQEATEVYSSIVEHNYNIRHIFVFPSLQSCLNDPVQQTVVRKFEKLIPYMDVFLLKLVNEVGSIETFFKKDHDDFAEFFTNVIINQVEKNFPEINSEEDADKFAYFCAKSFTMYKIYKTFDKTLDVCYDVLDDKQKKQEFEDSYKKAVTLETVLIAINQRQLDYDLSDKIRMVLADQTLPDILMSEPLANNVFTEYVEYIYKLALLRQFVNFIDSDIYLKLTREYNFKEIISDGEKKKQFDQMFNVIEIYREISQITWSKNQYIQHENSSMHVLFNNAMLGTLPDTYHDHIESIIDYITKICDIDSRLSLLKEFSYTEFQKPENQDMLKCIVKIKPFFEGILDGLLSEPITDEEVEKIRKICQNVYKNFNDISCVDKNQTMKNCVEILQYTKLQLFIEQIYSDNPHLKDAILADFPSYKEFKDNEVMRLRLVLILENKSLVTQHYLGDRKNKKHWLEFMSNISYLYNSNQYNQTLKHIDGLYNFLFNTSNLGQFVEETLQDQQCKCKDFLLLCLMVSSNDISQSEDSFSQRYSLEKIFNAFDLIFQAKNPKDARQLDFVKNQINKLLHLDIKTGQEISDRMSDVLGFIFGKADILSRCRIEEAKDLLYIVDIKQETMSVEKNEELKSSSIDNQNENKEEDKKTEPIKNSITNIQIFKKAKNYSASRNPGKEMKHEASIKGKLTALFKKKNQDSNDTLNKGKIMFDLDKDNTHAIDELNKK